MFRDLVSPTRTSAAAELEAITSERDFFKEKYAAHASEMEAMKIQLKESQRMVDKLRNQVLDLSQQVMELKGGGVGEEQDQLDSRVSSLTEMSNCEADTDNALDLQQSRRNSSVSSELSSKSANKKETDKEDNNSEKENNVKNEEVDSEDVEGESEGDSDDDDSHDNDEAEAIRLKASRMLAWASYQTSTRRTPTKMDDSDEGRVAMETPTQPINGRPSAAYTLPTKIQSLLDDDEDTDASLLVEKHQVASDSKVRGGKIGKFVNNLKDIMGTQSESDSSYEDEHDDYESSSDSECSNISENLARMQLDVRFADGQDEH